MLAPVIRTLAILFAACFGTALLTVPPAAADPEDTELTAAGTSGELCRRAQIESANLHSNRFYRRGGELQDTAYPDLASFASSKPQVQPLTVTHYTTYEDAGATLPKQVRCKGKSADHINAVYGENTAGPEGTCAAANRRTLREIARSLTPQERKALKYRPNDVVLDADTEAATGQQWLADFPTATVDSAGRLHLPSSSLFVPLDTPGIPEAFKGQHYCTLVAPSHLLRLLSGTVTP